MSVSSHGFFENFNQGSPEENKTANLVENLRNSVKQKHLITIAVDIDYKDISESNMAYIANVNNQNLKKHNAALREIKSQTNLDAEKKKTQYIEYLLHNLYFIELQVMVYAGYGKKEALNLLNEAETIRSQILELSDGFHIPKPMIKVVASFWEKQWENFKSFLSEFLSISKLIQMVGNAHLWRIAMVFARITFQEMLLTFSRWDFFIDLLSKNPNNYAGLELNVENIVTFINQSKVVFNSLSVALPAARLLGHFILLIKHSIASTELEKDLTAKTRILRELKKRYYVIGNDVVWTIVNLLTNFNDLFKITATNAMLVTVAFMFFDVLWMLPNWYTAFYEFQQQKELLEKELVESGKDTIEYSTIFNNLKQLDINWQAKSDANLYSMIATGLFCLGFIVATLVPVLAIPGYLLCNFAMALNLVGNDFTNMREKRLALDLTPASSNEEVIFETSILEREYAMVRNHFYVTLLVYTVLPTLTMGVFAVCWPAAIPLAAAFIAFQLLSPKWQAHQQASIENMRQEQHERLLENTFGEKVTQPEQEAPHLSIEHRSETEGLSFDY